jgi:hypothetical protein
MWMHWIALRRQAEAVASKKELNLEKKAKSTTSDIT